MTIRPIKGDMDAPIHRSGGCGGLVVPTSSAFAVGTTDASQDVMMDDIVEAAVRQAGASLHWAPRDMEAHVSQARHREIVMLAVSNDGAALQWAHRRLRRDRGVVLAAVRSHGLALEFAGQGLRDDCEVVRAAVHSTPEAWRFASDRLRRM